MIRRIVLMMAVNILVVLAISVILSALGLNNYLDSSGAISYSSLLTYCLIWGMVGSFISLFISKWMIKRMMRIEIVDGSAHYAGLVARVHDFANRAGLPKMPEVGVYESDEMNAIAAGRSKNNSMVAVSTGLLNRMNRDELDGVLAHEVAHIANGDMVTMTLVQGVVNAFALFLTEIATHAIEQFMRDEEGGGLSFITHLVLHMVLYTMFSFLCYPIVAWVSRQREFRADSDGARIAGKDKMVAALAKLQSAIDELGRTEPQVQVMNISARKSFLQIMSTHPPLEDRIAALHSNSVR